MQSSLLKYKLAAFCLLVSVNFSFRHILVDPNINSSGIVNNTSGTAFTLRVNADQAGTVYYVVNTSDTDPTASEIKNGDQGGGTPAPISGSFVNAANTNADEVISGLIAGTTYYIHFIVENGSAETSVVQELSAVATDATPPGFNPGTTAINITSTGFTFRVNVDEASTVYYVVTTSAAVPSATQVLAGQDENGVAATRNGSAFTNASTNLDQAIAGLSPGTTYYIYGVAEDASSNASVVAVTSATTLCTPVNVTGLSVSDASTTAMLSWSDPSCFDQIIVAVKATNTVSGGPAFGNDGSGYITSLDFAAAAAADFDASARIVFSGGAASSPITITNLTNGTTYHFKVFTRKGDNWSSGAAVATAVGPPVIVSLTPTDNSSNILTNETFTITFNEDIFISTTGAINNFITFDKAGVGDLMINRDNSGPHGTVNITGNVATIILSTDLTINTAYDILIGNRVFRDASSNHFAGTVTDAWDFTTTAVAASVTAPTVGVCEGQYTLLGNIVLTEGNDNDFQGTDNGSFTLVIGFDQPGYIFKPGTAGVTATVDPAGDIQSVTATSVSYTQATFSIQFKDVLNDPQAKDNHDAITLTGLRISTDGSTPPPAILLLKSATTLSMQGISEEGVGQTTLGTINAGTVPPIPTITWPGNDNTYCEGANLSAITITASGGTSYNWYNDAALTSILFTNQSNRTAAQVFGGAPGTGTFTKYVTNIDGCESSAIPVTLVITGVPVAEAGNPQMVCPGEPVSIGGSPTATGGSGSYVYNWTAAGYPSAGSFSSTASNPIFNAPDNTSAGNYNVTYTVTVSDNNLCSATDNVNIEVKTTNENVIFTEPNTFFYTTSNTAVNLKGSPAGGTFSGVGVTQLDGAFKFDPKIAGIGTWPVTYTTTLTNGCTKTVTQNFTVSPPFEVFSNLADQYCNNESNISLRIADAMVTQIMNYINVWNTQYVPNYGYAPLKPVFSGIVRNEYAAAPGYGYGENNGIVKDPGNSTYTSGGQVLDRYIFSPSAFQTDQAYPNCFNCNYANIAVYIEFANPAFTYPYNIPPNTDYGYLFRDGSTAAFRYTGEFININPVPNVFFNGLKSGLVNDSDFCNIDNNYVLSGNKNSAGIFQLGTNASSFDDVANDGLLNTTPGNGQFNPKDAYDFAPSEPNRYIRYEVDPGTKGSLNQACAGRATQMITLRTSTSINFPGSVDPSNTSYCYAAESTTIQTNIGTGPSTGVEFTGFGISDNKNGTAFFVPKVAFDQKDPASTNPEDVTISATYTNTYGCKTTITRDYTVYPKPVSTFTVTENGSPAANLNFCYNEDPINLNGNQPVNSMQQYFIDFIGLGYTETVNGHQMSFDPDVYFDKALNEGASNVSDAQFSVTYHVTDQIGCTASTSKVLTISPLAEIIISGIQDGTQFCSNSEPFTLTFGPVGGTLKINNINQTNKLDAKNSLLSTNIPLGVNIPIEYEYRSGLSQCLNTNTYIVHNIAAPHADFSTTPTCDGSATVFSAANDPVSYKWTWILGDSVRSGTDAQTINHVFPGLSGATQTSYTIKLVTENDPSAPLVCRDSAEAVQVIGAFPNIDFNYANVCEDDFTKFSITSDIPVASAEWNFGDGSGLPDNPLNSLIPAGTHSGRTTGKFGEPEHQFIYNQGVPNRPITRLIARTPQALGACADTVYHQVAILEKLSPSPADPYLMAELNDVEGLWIEEDRADSSTWVFAVPNGKNIIDNSAGPVWITNATGPYKAKDHSYVNSPCFNLTAYTKPVISLQYWNHTDLSKDGAVIQYSTNGGATWNLLGNMTSGIEWFNEENISSSPGGQNLMGWSGRTQQQWKTGKNSLDGLNLANIRFRIAFSSDERDEYDGFAFNNVRIEERNRNMLIEHFTNATAEASAGNLLSKTNFNTASELSTETVRMQYHTSFPGPDPINAQGSEDHNARAAFYGISNQNVPAGFIDGNRNTNLNALSFETPWYVTATQKRQLSASPFEVTAETLPANPDEIKVNVTVNRIDVLASEKPVLYVAVVEKSVAGNNEFVLRKFLPHAAGIPLKTPPDNIVPETFEATYTWQVRNVGDLSQLAVIAFVQDEITKEVHQSFILSDPDPATLPSVITDIEQPAFAEQVMIYPNPADEEIRITLPAGIKQSVLVTLIDGFGRAVQSTRIDTGRNSKIETKALAGGVYILQLETPKGLIRKKVMIVHD